MKYVATQLNPSCRVNTWTEYEHPGIRAWTDDGWRKPSVVADDIDYWEWSESMLNEAWDYKKAIITGKWPKDDTYLNVREFIHHNLPVREYTDAEIRDFIACFREMFWRHESKWNIYEEATNQDVCNILSVLHHKTYVCRGFSGYSQGDYIEIAYAKEDYPGETIGVTVADALGQYDEYSIEDESGDCFCCEVYDPYGNADCGSVENQLRDIIGLKPGDTLVIRTISGYPTRPDYEETEVTTDIGADGIRAATDKLLAKFELVQNIECGVGVRPIDLNR